MDMNPIVLALAGLLGFVFLREVFCWYWKLNEVVGLLKTIVDRLERLEGRGAAAPPAARPQPARAPMP